MEAWRDLKSITAEVISWQDIEKLLKMKEHEARKGLLKSLLHIERLSEAAEALVIPKPTLPTRDERDYIIEFLARQAEDPTTTMEEYFRYLALKAELPNPTQFHWDQGDAETNALKLVKFATETSWVFPPNHAHAGEPTLGLLLKILIDQRPSPDVNKKFVKIIFEHGLIRDQRILKELRTSISEPVQ